MVENLENKANGEPKSAKQLLEEFPEDIPGMALVDKFVFPDYERVLVHIRQEHYVPRNQIADYLSLGRQKGVVEPQEINEVYRKISAIQKNILEGLEYLQDTLGVREIYAEGLTGPLFPWVAGRRIGDLWGEMIEGGVPEDMVEDYCFAVGAEAILAAKRKLKLRETESEDLVQKEGPFANFEEREDYVLRTVAKIPEKMSLVTFGAGHDFMRNIWYWNEKNPTQRYSLIEVTPKGVDSSIAHLALMEEERESVNGLNQERD